MSNADPDADILMSISSSIFIAESWSFRIHFFQFFLFFPIVQCGNVISVQVLSHTSC